MNIEALKSLKAEVPEHLKGTSNGNHYRDGYADCLFEVRHVLKAQPTPTSAARAGNAVVYVCPERDIECGNNPVRWCDSCDKDGYASARKPFIAHIDTKMAEQRNEGAIEGRIHQRGVDAERIEAAEARVRELEAALQSYVTFANTRRTELGSLSEEMETVDAQARATLASRSLPNQAVVYPPDGTVSPFTVVNLGTGKVQIGCSVHDKRLHALWFGKSGTGVMGEEQELNRAAEEGETIAVVTFADVEGLDVLLEVVERIRRKAFPNALPRSLPTEAAGSREPVNVSMSFALCNRLQQNGWKYEGGPIAHDVLRKALMDIGFFKHEHPNLNVPNDPACSAKLDELGDDRGQGLDGYWKWGFRAGWHHALAAQLVDQTSAKPFAWVKTKGGKLVLDEDCIREHNSGFDGLVDADQWTPVYRMSAALDSSEDHECKCAHIGECDGSCAPYIRQSKAAQPVPSKEAVGAEQYQTILETLKSYRLSKVVYADDDSMHYQLIDLLTPDDKTIDLGAEEVEYMTDAIFNALNDLAGTQLAEAPSAEPVGEKESAKPSEGSGDVEAAAKAIYALLPPNAQGSVADYPWQDGGNSHMQELARDMARAALKANSAALPTEEKGGA